MRPVEDPRVKVSRRAFFLAWVFFFVYIIAVMGASYFLGIKPRLWGLPQWVAIGNILVPAVFVVLLLFLVERFIPNVFLTDEETEQRGPE